MEKKYWTGRRRAGSARTRKARRAEGPLVRYELTHRTVIKGAHGIAFLLRQRKPAMTSERAILHLPLSRPGE